VTGPVFTKEQLLQRLRRNARPILDCGVERLELFGSFARNEGRPGSDIDLLVEFRPGWKTYDNFLALSVLLEALLGHPVELVTRESLSPYLGPSILSEAEDVALRA
jgi:predicted nucleotidyltransferase